ncbi:MAG: BofC C-terminal domain-containing protein [Bacillota bacterium]|nr:BofC C-terminal domain-containing protein [Bacillota bacterium]
MRAKRYLIVLGVAAAVLTTVLVLSPFYRGHDRAVDRSPVVGEGATVLYRTTYLLCGYREEREAAVWPELVGCTQEEFMKHHPGWTLLSFSPTRIELERQVEAICPDMVSYRFLTISDGKVAVYYGRSRDHLLLKEVTPVDARTLLPEDRELLQQGVLVEGDGEVTRFLEGLGD